MNIQTLLGLRSGALDESVSSVCGRQTSSRQAAAHRVAFWIPELDGLRAVACGLVVVAHFNPWIIEYKASPLLQPIKAIMGGNMGVMLFFCLSAFLLTSICLAEIERKGRINLGAFFLRRILRIWPLYFFMLAVTMLVIWPGGPLRQAPGASTSPEQWAWATRSVGWYALFGGNWLDHKISEIGILWTICVEEQFYFTLPFALMLALRLPRKILLVPLAVVVTGISIWLFSGRTGIATPYYQTTTYISTFVFGGAAAFAYRSRRLPAELSGPLPLLGCLALLLIVLSNNQTFWWGPYDLWSIALYQLVPALLVFVVWWVAKNSGAPSIAFLRSPLARSLGILSYGIYLTHVLIHRVLNLETSWLRLNDVGGAVVYHILFIQYASLAVLMAALARAFVEAPALALRKRFLPNNNSAIDAQWIIRWQKPAITAIVVSALSFAVLWFLSRR